MDGLSISEQRAGAIDGQPSDARKARGPVFERGGRLVQLAALPYEEQLAAVRPTGPLPPMQLPASVQARMAASAHAGGCGCPECTTVTGAAPATGADVVQRCAEPHPNGCRCPDCGGAVQRKEAPAAETVRDEASAGSVTDDLGASAPAGLPDRGAGVDLLILPQIDGLLGRHRVVPFDTHDADDALRGEAEFEHAAGLLQGFGMTCDMVSGGTAPNGGGKP